MQYTVERSYVKNKLKNRLYYMITQKSQRKSFDCNLAERWPLALSALVHIVIGVSISVEHGSRAQFVYGVETDPRGIPKTHCSIFMPTHGKKRGLQITICLTHFMIYRLVSSSKQKYCTPLSKFLLFF